MTKSCIGVVCVHQCDLFKGMTRKTDRPSVCSREYYALCSVLRTILRYLVEEGVMQWDRVLLASAATRPQLNGI